MTANSNASYTYDSNGNTLTKTVGSNTTTYTWDYENRLTSVMLPGSGGTVTFKYDPLGRRTYKSSSAGTFNYAYDGAGIVEAVNTSGNPLARYTQGPVIDEPLAELQGSTTSYYQADGIGSVTSLSNAAGALAQTYTFDSFGKITNSSGSVTNPFQYTAREFDAETGLYYYRARYYDSLSGRFLSEDPIRFYGGSEFYGYVENDPIDSDDQTGLFTIRNNIQLHYTPDVDASCGPHQAGACTRAQAILMAVCECTGSGYRAKAVLGIYGDMYVFNGTWPYKGRTPKKDKSVKDADSAINHENNVHINPAIQSVTPMINKLESRIFKTLEECRKQVEKITKAVHNDFNLDLIESQREENME
jgi:RHS repeat-associated protein